MKRMGALLCLLILLTACLPGVVLYDLWYFDNKTNVKIDLIVDLNPDDSLVVDSYRTIVCAFSKSTMQRKLRDSWEKHLRDSVIIYLAMEGHIDIPSAGMTNPKEIQDSVLYAKMIVDKDVFLDDVRTVVFPPRGDNRIKVFYYNGYSALSLQQ